MQYCLVMACQTGFNPRFPLNMQPQGGTPGVISWCRSTSTIQCLGCARKGIQLQNLSQTRRANQLAVESLEGAAERIWFYSSISGLSTANQGSKHCEQTCMEFNNCFFVLRFRDNKEFPPGCHSGMAIYLSIYKKCFFLSSGPLRTAGPPPAVIDLRAEWNPGHVTSSSEGHNQAPSPKDNWESQMYLPGLVFLDCGRDGERTPTDTERTR